MGHFSSLYFGPPVVSAHEYSAILRDAAMDEHAAEPKSVTVDGVTVANHSLPDLVALDKHQRATCAAKRGIKFTKLTMPSAV